MLGLRRKSPVAAVRGGVEHATLMAFGAQRLRALCEGAGLEHQRALALFERMVWPWGAARVGRRPTYPSNIADDEAPYEFCLALGGAEPELQFYVEPLAQPASLRANTQAARELLGSIGSELGAGFARWQAIEDLFFPAEPSGPFTLWLGVTCSGSAPPRLKIYLNPQVRGPARAQELITAAAERLGYAQAWANSCERLSFVADSAGRRDEIGIVSLDMRDDAQARFKVYVRHHRATVEQIATIAEASDSLESEDATRFYGALALDRGPFLAKPPLTEAAFTDARPERAADTTLEFPLNSYVSDDEAARQRVEACLDAFGIASEPYSRALRRFALRPLNEHGGLHAHVTFCRRATPAQRQPRVAIYFASEAYLRSPKQELSV